MKEPGGYKDYAEVAGLYDWIIPYRSRQDVAFFVEAALSAEGPVLELGCGTGRVLIPTARAGVEITGLDLSPHMLEVCRQNLDDEPEEVRSRVQLVRGDMRKFELGGTFALITAPFRPFQHLTSVEDQLACLACIHRHLADDGRLILDIFNPSLDALTEDVVGQEIGGEPEFSTPDGREVAQAHRIISRDYYRQIIEVELIYDVIHPDGQRERLVHGFPMRYTFRFEGEHLLARCGFETEAVFADYERSPYGSKYPGELIFLARKAA